VHQPRHLHESARLFGPTILEVCNEFRLWPQLITSSIRCAHGQSGMSYPSSGALSLPISSSVLFSNSLVHFPTFTKILHYHFLTSPMSLLNLGPDCFRASSLGTLSGRCWSTSSIDSCSTLMRSFLTDPFSSCCIFYCTESITICLWIGEPSLFFFFCYF